MKKYSNVIKVFEAFAGYGSQHIALKRLRKKYPEFKFKIVGISDIDKAANEAYSRLHGKKITNYGDIKKIDWEKVPNFDLLFYSFPCQDISNAGKKRGFSQDSNSRSSLIWECLDAIIIKKPKYLIMENVKNIKSDRFADALNEWGDKLRKLGYVSVSQILDAQDFGLAQHRERFFMVSILGKEETFVFPRPIAPRENMFLQLDTNVDKSYYLNVA